MTDVFSNGADLGIFLDLNQRFAAAVGAGKQSERDKLLVMAGGWLHLQSLGGLDKTTNLEGAVVFAPSDAIAGMLAARNIKNKVDALNHCAQLVLGYVIETITDKKEKKDARNLVDRAAKLFRAFDWFDEAGDLPTTEATLADWVEAKGGLDGVVADYKANALASDEEELEEEFADLSEIHSAITLNGVSIACEEPFDAEAVLSVVRRDEEGKLIVLPLPAAPASLMTSLLPYLPAPDANLPDAARFWGAVASCCAMVGRSASAEVARPGEEQHSNSPTLPSSPIVRIVEPRQVSIAASRVDAGIVCYVSASGDTALSDEASGRHINARGTKALTDHLSGGVSRAMYDGLSWNKLLNRLDFTPRDTRYKPFAIDTLPMSKFGSSRWSDQWTIDVREFDEAAKSVVDLDDGRLPDELVKFAAKAATSKHRVSVKVTKGELTLALGAEAQPIAIPSSGEQKSASAEIAPADLAKVVKLCAELKPSRLAVRIDKGGLVLFTAATRVADVLLFVPTLLKEGGRNPARLERISRPRDADAVSANTDEQAAPLAA